MENAREIKILMKILIKNVKASSVVKMRNAKIVKIVKIAKIQIKKMKV
jgi:hypothetical protein